jgi:hypothetical protein
MPTAKERTAIVCVADEVILVPNYPEGRYPVCGQILYSVPVIVGIPADAI